MTYFSDEEWVQPEQLKVGVEVSNFGRIRRQSNGHWVEKQITSPSNHYIRIKGNDGK